MHAVILSSCFFLVCHAQNENGNSNDALYHVGSLSFKSILSSTLQPSMSPSASPSIGPTPFPTKQVSALYLSVSVKVSRRIGGRKKSHAFRIQINAREMHQRLLNDFVTCDLVTD